MRSVPAFVLSFRLGRLEQSALALLGAASAAAMAAWALSHLEASVSTAPGSWLLPLWAVAAVAAAVGGLLAWALTPRRHGRIAWHQGRWTLQHDGEQPCEGTLCPVLDAGSWLLLRFDPLAAGHACWVSVGRQATGAAWHPLRAALFAPGSSTSDAPGEGARP